MIPRLVTSVILLLAFLAGQPAAPLGSPGGGPPSPQFVAKDPVKWKEWEADYRAITTDEKRAFALSNMVRENMTGSFLFVLEALRGVDGSTKQEAAGLAGLYFTAVPFGADYAAFMNHEFPEAIVAQRETVSLLLRDLVGSNQIETAMNALESLTRMGEIDQLLLNRMCAIARSENSAHWTFFDVPPDDRPDRVNAVRGSVTNYLLFIKHQNLIQADVIDPCLQRLLDELPDADALLRSRKEAIRRVLTPKNGESPQGRLAPVDSEYWSPAQAVAYANKHWLSPNSLLDSTCSPFKFYSSNDCSNFVSQCLWAGGLNVAGDGCVPDECCIVFGNVA